MKEESKKPCGEVCGDNRFEVIDRAKKYIIESTNIETDKQQMECLDSFLFRLWQLGLLDRFDDSKRNSEEFDFKMHRAKDLQFPIPEKGGRCHESACGAAGFELGAHWAFMFLVDKYCNN